MSFESDETVVKRPMPTRPKFAWQAWTATMGYIHINTSADVTLQITIAPMTHYISWGASLKWGHDLEHVSERHSLSMALNDLWALIEQNHDLTPTRHAAIRRPINYTEDNTLDQPTYAVFSHLVNTTDAVFHGNWQIIATYRPIEIANKRVQARLTADNHTVNRSGNGVTLREACHRLLRNAAATFHHYQQQK